MRPNASLEELYPKSRAYIVREESGRRVVDVVNWDVLGGQGPWPMTNVRNLRSPQWTTLASAPPRRCLVPLTEFCEWTPDKHQVGEGKPVKGEMWFAVPEQPILPSPASGSRPSRDRALPWSPVTRTNWSRRSIRKP